MARGGEVEGEGPGPPTSNGTRRTHGSRRARAGKLGGGAGALDRGNVAAPRHVGQTTAPRRPAPPDRSIRPIQQLDIAPRIPYLVSVRCPSCGATDTRVIDSREAEDGASIRRRRACDGCDERFTTFERSESARIQVLKRDGSRQEFDRRKLASAITKAASKQLSAEAISSLIDGVEATIRQSGTSEIASGRIGELVLERLAVLDPMSYLRFQIVYARLDDPEALLAEVDRLFRRRASARRRRADRAADRHARGLPGARRPR